MPQVASDSTIHAANRPLPRLSRPPQQPDRAPSPFESVLDSSGPPAADAPPPPPDSKTAAPENPQPPAKVDDAKTTASTDSTASASQENSPAGIQETSDDAKPKSARKVAASAKSISSIGDSVKSDGDQKAGDSQKTDTPNVPSQVNSGLALATQQVIAAGSVANQAATPASTGGDTVEPALQQAQLSVGTAAHFLEATSAQSKTNNGKNTENSGKVGAGDNAGGNAPADAVDDNLQLTTNGPASPHSDDKQQPAAADTDKQHIARSEVPLPNQHPGVSAQATANADSSTVSTPQMTGDTVQQSGIIKTPQPTTELVAPSANPPSQLAPQAAAIPLAGVAVEIAGRALAGKNRFEIRLDPPELGRIEVRLDVDRDGNVTSRLTVDRPDTLTLLQRDASGLERALQDAGLKTSDNGLQFSLRDQSMGQQQTNSGPDTAQLLVQDDSLTSIDLIPQSYGRLAGQGGGLDIRV